MLIKRKKKVLQKAARTLIAHNDPRSVNSEQFRTIRTGIDFSMPDKELETLLITSAAPSEGKSTVAANIAVVYAQNGKKVLLVDADLRKPTVHYTFSLVNNVGLTNLLAKNTTLQVAVKKSEVEGLDILTCGSIPPNPAELLGSKSMDNVIEMLKEHYDLVIFDAPPLLSVTDGQILGQKCDGIILVVSAGSTEKENIVKAKEALALTKTTILGVVLNNFTLTKDHYYYNYYGAEE
ncbi:CpsD/CapB family tyrosine-protein kinase [Sporosarcina thermotolerans]|uniref:non-specific protein-tyrosine kinase n=1 Tax=Sporosarcina thermotolerans TaxID=633404 RepID=A0AAW9A5Y9_9BACL|nr:CpsD/CapB family tyrosine-protein kinase [Sporosarcina thermotolerans]MDW0116315.1 CpsD/CapB family tyrosine-protein kinase [Sporosarcina thermotolerans]WHT48278.1 CpsD/CapB family tyrosine-protein kinase [Sporosarcina thermotolerans]